MKLLNSSTGLKTDINDQRITIYNCGPTVYNYVHIGNVRPLIVFDVLHRFLLSQRHEVVYIQNITDVDDKIIVASAKENIPEKTLTDRFTKAYIDLFDILNIRKVMMPHVSDHIEDIKEYIQKLIDRDAAYVVDGDVYFDVSKIKDYGHISHQNIEALLDGVRKENKTNKKNPLDFVLWKKTEQGINWDSRWSKGRPGWHTECCVLINKFAGDHVTIHGGGVDLKFPHHENENAQNQAMFNRDIADVWMHVGHININGAKMSKSLNNFILVKDIVTEDNAMGLRWYFYKAKYQQPVNFTKELFEEADKEIKKIIKTIIVAKAYTLANDMCVIKTMPMSSDFIDALNDDLNLPNAITVIQSQIKQLNSLIRAKKYSECNELGNTLAKELEVLGIKFTNNVDRSDIELIKNWQNAVDEKRFADADAMREELTKKGLL